MHAQAGRPGAGRQAVNRIQPGPVVVAADGDVSGLGRPLPRGQRTSRVRGHHGQPTDQRCRQRGLHALGHADQPGLGRLGQPDAATHDRPGCGRQLLGGGTLGQGGLAAGRVQVGAVQRQQLAGRAGDGGHQRGEGADALAVVPVGQARVKAQRGRPRIGQHAQPVAQVAARHVLGVEHPAGGPQRGVAPGVLRPLLALLLGAAGGRLGALAVADQAVGRAQVAAPASLPGCGDLLALAAVASPVAIGEPLQPAVAVAGPAVGREAGELARAHAVGVRGVPQLGAHGGQEVGKGVHAAPSSLGRLRRPRISTSTSTTAKPPAVRG